MYPIKSFFSKSISLLSFKIKFKQLKLNTFNAKRFCNCGQLFNLLQYNLDLFTSFQYKIHHLFIKYNFYLFPEKMRFVIFLKQIDTIENQQHSEFQFIFEKAVLFSNICSQNEHHLCLISFWVYLLNIEDGELYQLSLKFSLPSCTVCNLS